MIDQPLWFKGTPRFVKALHQMCVRARRQTHKKTRTPTMYRQIRQALQLCRFLKSRSTTFLICFHQHQGNSQPQQNSYQLRNDWELWIPFPFMAASSSIIGYLMIFMHIYGSFITVVTKIPSRAARLRRWAWLCGAMKHRFDLYVRYTIEIDLPNPITTLEGLNGHLICTHSSLLPS